METAVFQFTISALFIIVAGIVLTKCADQLAEETGLGRVFIGSIFLAGATSLPELIVDLNAVWLNQPDLAVGDLLGSSLFNLLILALIDSFFRHPQRAFSRDFAHHAQTAVLSINLTALVGIGILSRLNVSCGRVGLFSWIVGFVYFIGVRIAFVRPDKNSANSVDWKELVKRKSAFRAILGFFASTGVILISAPYIVQAADTIASLSGLGHTFVGTTLVALSTSLPELVATIAAFRIGAPDLALGNIFGSNTFNMLLFFPLDLFYPGNLFTIVRPIHALTAFCIIAISSVAVMGQISRKQEKKRIWEPSSELIVILTFAFLYLLYRSKSI